MNELVWNRIVEAARLLAKHHQVEVPETLEKVSGTIWERFTQRRDALNAFLAKIGMEPFGRDVPVEEIADQLDEAVLPLLPERAPEPETSRRRRKAPAPVEADEGQ